MKRKKQPPRIITWLDGEFYSVEEFRTLTEARKAIRVKRRSGILDGFGKRIKGTYFEII